jgi:putative peptidoglycan lipid II flippase
MRNVVARGTRQLLFLMVPTAAATLVLSDPITQVIYERGEFDAAQSELVSEALFYFALSLPFAGVNLLLIRTFFSLQRPWVPTLIALGNLVLTAGLNAILYKPMGVGGIVLATAIVSLITAIALAAVLRPALGGLDGRRTLDTGLRILIASALLAAASLAVKEVLDGVVADDFGGQFLVIAAAGTAGLLVYMGSVVALRIEEGHQVWSLIRGLVGGLVRRS